MNNDESRPVSWREVEEHLVRRLMIDDEWMVRGEESFTWWPWFLEQSFRVTALGMWEDDPDDNYVTVLARTPIASCDERTGLALCEEASWQFPLGCFVWGEGVLSAVTSLSLNPRCRGLLSLFHEAALAQALVAHELAAEWAVRESLDVEILYSAHPESGPREDMDELLGLFGGSGRSDGMAQVPEWAELLPQVREFVRSTLVQSGHEVIRSDEGVDILGHGNRVVMVGEAFDADDVRRFGKGLAVVVPISGTAAPFTEWQVSNCALSMIEHPVTSLLGSIRVDPRPDGFGTHLHCHLTSGYIAEFRGDPQQCGISVLNAALHCMAAVSIFWQEVEAAAGE